VDGAARRVTGLFGEKGEGGMARLEERKGIGVMRGGGMF